MDKRKNEHQIGESGCICNNEVGSVWRFVSCSSCSTCLMCTDCGVGAVLQRCAGCGFLRTVAVQGKFRRKGYEANAIDFSKMTPNWVTEEIASSHRYVIWRHRNDIKNQDFYPLVHDKRFCRRDENADMSGWFVCRCSLCKQAVRSPEWEWYVAINNESPPVIEAYAYRWESLCAVATAAIGDPASECLDLLRDYREKYIKSFVLGQVLSRYYDKIKMSAAHIVYINAAVRWAVLWLLVKPAIYLLKFENRFARSGIFLLFLLLLCTATVLHQIGKLQNSRALQL